VLVEDRMSGVDAKRDGDKVRITVRIGEKTARLGVTREYARALAAELLEAAADESDNDPLSKIIDAAARIAGDRTGEFERNLRERLKALKSKGRL
jgi:hypothetical protein